MIHEDELNSRLKRAMTLKSTPRLSADKAAASLSASAFETTRFQQVSPRAFCLTEAAVSRVPRAVRFH